MKSTSQPVENSGASGSPVAASGKASAKMVTEPALASAPVAEAPAAKSPAAPAQASRPLAVSAETSKPLEFSPGVAELSPAERRAAFMAAATEPKAEAPKEEPAEETETTAETKESESTSEATETETAVEEKPTETTEEEELVSGLAKHAEKSPELKALLKRTQKVLKQNSERKAEIEAMKAQLDAKNAAPVAVLAPSPDHPFIHLTTEEQVEAEAESLITDARKRVRWLERHLEDDVPWNEGTEYEQPMTPKQKAAALDYYEDIKDRLAKDWAQTRKEEIAAYKATLKELDIAPEDLVKPAVPTRESKMFTRVPELMRDPTYLQFLADAKAGREAREERSRGVKVVKVDPSKSKAKPEKESEASTPSGKTPAPVPTADIDALRQRSSQGDQDARQALRRAFVQQVA